MPANRLDNLRSLRLANADGSFSTAFGTLVTGAFLVGFIQRLGGSDLWIGALTGIPSLLGILQIPGAIWGRSFAGYRKFIAPGGLIWRLLYMPLILLPFAPLPNAAKLTVLTTCVLVASSAILLVNPLYNDWIAEMVPSNSLGFFFSRRNAILTAVGAVVGLVGAFVLDQFRSHGKPDLGFSIIFGFASICAWISFSFFLKMRDLPREVPAHQGLKEAIRAIGVPFGDGGYRKVLIFLGVATIGQTFAGNFYFAFGRESLHLPFVVLVGATTVQSAGQVLSAKFWGFLSDKYGNKPCLMLSGLGLALNPLPWVFCTPGHTAFNEWLLCSTSFLMGIFWSGVNIPQFNLMLTTSDPKDRANYIGSGMAVTALIGGASPLLGAVVMASLRTGGDPEMAYKIVFIIGSVLRIFTLFSLSPVQEQGAIGVRATWRDLRTVTPRGYRAMRSLSRTADASLREQAIESVGVEKTSLASDDIIKALHDPLPRVRRQAAAALARLRDPRATGELIHQIVDHPDLLEEETVWALGMLGDPAAIPALIKTLESPRALLRRAAASALGRIGTSDDVNVTKALNGVASDAGDPDLRRAALQALRWLGSHDSVDVVCAALNDPLPSVRIAASEAAAELRIHEAVPRLREAIGHYRDEAASESAYALGAVGTMADLPLILEEAARSQSMITRRRCLLGVSSLLGVEQEAYRLLLREGMDQDTMLMEMLRPLTRKSPKAGVALERYAANDEKGALSALHRATGLEWLEPMIEQPVEELFLVAACAVVKK